MAQKQKMKRRKKTPKKQSSLTPKELLVYLLAERGHMSIHKSTILENKDWKKCRIVVDRDVWGMLTVALEG